jgi:hypothetical protein
MATEIIKRKRKHKAKKKTIEYTANSHINLKQE